MSRTVLGCLCSETNVGEEEVLRSRVGPERTPHHGNVRKTRRSVAPPQQISRSGFSSFVFDVFRGDGEWSPTPPID